MGSTFEASTSSGARQPLEARPLGTIHRAAPAVLVHEDVLDRILKYSEAGMAREIGGFLLGDRAEAPRPYVRIRHFLPAAGTRGDAASLTFTHQTWSVLNRQLEKHHPDQKVVGWHHTHPDLGVFLSGYDMFLHRHFFPEPWQVALVVDPCRQEFGFFQWVGPEVESCGFYFLPPEEPEAT